MTRRGKHPTDRGWAWVVLAASMGSHFLNGALAYSVGVLHVGLLHTFESESVTMVAMAGAVNTGLVCIAAPLAGYIINRFGCRTCCVLGGLLCFAGYTSSAFVTSIVLLFFTFGIIAGTGLGLIYSATNITIGFYFERLRGVASGISNSFQGVGILSGSVIFQALIDTYRVSGTFLLLGAVSLHFCFFGMFFRPSIYEGNSLEIEAEDPQEITDMKMEATDQEKHLKELNLADFEEESQSLLEKSRESRAEVAENVISGLSRRVSNIKDDIRAVNTDGATAETVNINDVSANTVHRDGSTAENVNINYLHGNAMNIDDEALAEEANSSPTQQSVTETRSDMCDSVPTKDTLPGITSDNQNELKHQRCINTSETSAQSQEPHSVSEEQFNNPVSNRDALTNTDSALSGKTRPEEDSHQQHPSHEDEEFTNKAVSKQECERLAISSPDAALSGKTRPEEDSLQQHPSHEDSTTKAASSQERERLAISSPDALKNYQEGNSTGEQVQKRRWGCCGSYIRLLSDKAFMLHCVSLFVANVHIGGVFLHLPEYVQHHGTTPSKAAQLFVAVGCIALVSKLSCGFALSDPNIDPLILSMGMMGLNGIFTCLFPLYVDTYVKQMVFSALFGLYFGGLYALTNPILVRFAGVSGLADAYGISMFLLGMGYLLGPTLAAMILDAGGTYSHSFLFLGLMMLSGALLDMTAARFLQSREKIAEAKQNADWSAEDEGGVKTCQSQTEVANHEEADADAHWLAEDVSDTNTSQSKP
ncbi:hypothetical protein ACOMHN_039587 [Nucella lapillus]